MKNIFVDYNPNKDEVVFRDDSDKYLDYSCNVEIQKSFLISNIEKIINVDSLEITDLQKFLEKMQAVSLENQNDYTNLAIVELSGTTYTLALNLDMYDEYAVVSFLTEGDKKIYTMDYFNGDGSFSNEWTHAKYKLDIDSSVFDELKNQIKNDIPPIDYYYPLQDILDLNQIQYTEIENDI